MSGADAGHSSGEDDDPLAPLRDHERELEAIAESDAPDAPVAAVALALLRDEDIPEEALATLERGEVSGRA